MKDTTERKRECSTYERVHRKLEGKRSGVKKKCYQKKLRKIMEIALEKFRLPASGSARSGLLSLRNRGLKIGTFLKKISFQLCFCSEVQKCIKNMFVWAENYTEGISWWMLLKKEISGLIKHFRDETHSLRNDSFSNFDLKFLFCQYSDFAEISFKKSRFLWSIGNLKNIVGIGLSVPVQNKIPSFWGF